LRLETSPNERLEMVTSVLLSHGESGVKNGHQLEETYQLDQII
jgi:hypothetical protein